MGIKNGEDEWKMDLREWGMETVACAKENRVWRNGEWGMGKGEWGIWEGSGVWGMGYGVWVWGMDNGK